MLTKTPVKWEEKTLGDLITLEYGKGLDKEDRHSKGKYPAYGANGVKAWTDKFLYDKKTIIVGRKGSAGEINFTEEKFWALDVTYYTVFDEKILDLKFLYFILTMLNLPSLANGIKPGINRNDVYAIAVKIPPLEEQKRIIKIVDKAFEDVDKLTENAKQNLQNAKDLFDGYLNNLFSENLIKGEEKTLGEISQVKGGKRVPKGYKLQQNKTSYPYIRVTDFNNYGSVDLNDIHYISEEIFQQIKNYTISVQDLYISIAGTIGKSGIIPQELDGANLTENACKLVFKQNIYNKFIYYFTKTQSFTEQAFGKTRTAAMPKLALTRLATITLPIPSFKRQREITEKLDEIREETKQLEQIYQQKIEQAEKLKQSILQIAFSGEL